MLPACSVKLNDAVNKEKSKRKKAKNIKNSIYSIAIYFNVANSVTFGSEFENRSSKLIDFLTVNSSLTFILN